MLADAQAIATGIEPDFLWEVSGDAEFGFAELAKEYFGRAPTPGEAAALALVLHASPMHFYKKGKGRYKAAPIEALQAARAGVERKRREAEEVESYAAELLAHRLPPAFRDKLPMLLYKPDKLALETRALAAACDTARTHPLALLAACGAVPSTHEYHFNRFLFEAFPRGTGFPPIAELPPIPDLPLAAVRAFSIDDASTTEIDDAFSVRPLTNGNLEIGIHIAAPALSIARGSPLDAVARARLSTVYMPGRKITMLPRSGDRSFHPRGGDRAGRAFALCRDDARWHRRPAVDARGARADRGQSSPRCDQRMFRLGRISPPIPNGATSCARCGASRGSWRRARGKADVARVDYNFTVDWDVTPDGRVTILPRPRGSPLDKLVAELMIHVNSSWGKLLVDAGVPGLYRTQQTGKVRMSTKPEPHQGLGVAQYLWASSPLRRYSDLVNQRQLLATLDGGAPGLCRRRRRALRDHDRLRADVLAVRRDAGPDGALLVPALAAAGKRRRERGHRRPRQPGPLRRDSALRSGARPAGTDPGNAGTHRRRADRPSGRDRRGAFYRDGLNSAGLGGAGGGVSEDDVAEMRRRRAETGGNRRSAQM